MCGSVQILMKDYTVSLLLNNLGVVRGKGVIKNSIIPFFIIRTELFYHVKCYRLIIPFVYLFPKLTILTI
jgi:hypothetical protein